MIVSAGGYKRAVTNTGWFVNRKHHRPLAEFSSDTLRRREARAMISPLIMFYPSLLGTLLGHDNYILFPDDKGVPHLVDLNEPHATPEQLAIVTRSLSSIAFILYTRENPYGEAITNSAESITNSYFDPKRPTKIVTHGWMADGKANSCVNLRDAYLEALDCNVIVMDWGDIAKNIFYGVVADSVPMVAEHLAELINALQQHGSLDLKITKIVGHSLGAHIAGLAARLTKGTIAEIVGLDPAKPRFEGLGPGHRIDASDAAHVQIIHTNAGQLGLRDAIGTSDFYPNDGSTQPGCGIDIMGSCAHSRSYYYLAESIGNSRGFRSTPSMLLLYTARTGHVYMGGPTLDATARGRYSLQTASRSPYALG